MSAAEQYHERLAAYRLEEVALLRRLAWTGNFRFIFFLWGVAQLWITIYIHWLWLPGLIVPFGLFTIFSVLFENARLRLRRVNRALQWYSHGLARLEDRWTTLGFTGAEFLDENHPATGDLDVFGPGSMYQRLCDAHTRIGRVRLARWLEGPPDSNDAIRRRQEAARDLAPRLDWREELTLYGVSLPHGIDTARLDEWGNAVVESPSPTAGWIAPVLVAATMLTLLGWLLGWSVRPFLIAITAQVLFALILRNRVQFALAGLAGRSRDLIPLAGILRTIEREEFTAPLLLDLKKKLTDAGRRTPPLGLAGETPSRRLAQLARMIGKVDARQNTFFALIAPFFLWTTRVALQLEHWRYHTGPCLAGWLSVIGEMEALASLAGYAFENTDDAWPELADDGLLYQARDLGHPLLARAACVSNDVSLNETQRLLLVSGSNMSGKSTFLRTIGLNAVLALAGAPVRATALRLAPLVIGATLRIQDSLMKGQSRFFTEIRRLRQVVELTGQALPVLFLLDEILHGTNSHDRRIGTEGVIRTLLSKRTIGLVTTHDLALTEIAERLAPVAANVHFADHLEDGQMRFDYRLHAGVVRHSNALALMKAVGLDVAASAGTSPQTGGNETNTAHGDRAVKSVLFVCVENSNRSQMAQAFAIRHGGADVEAYSAGSRPSGVVNPKAVEAMRELGYDLTTHCSKSLDEIPKRTYDAAVTMGCGDNCPMVPAKRRLDWTIPDPKHMSPDEFRKVRDLIETKVVELLKEI